MAESWTSVFDIKRAFEYGRFNRNATVQRNQFPLQPTVGMFIVLKELLLIKLLLI